MEQESGGSPGGCQGNGQQPCQFAGLGGGFIHTEHGRYCLLHLRSDHASKDVEPFNEMIETYFRMDGNDLTNVALPEKMEEFDLRNAKVALRLQNCRAGTRSLQVRTGHKNETAFINCHFGGPVDFLPEGGKIVWRGDFTGLVKVKSDANVALDFQGARFIEGLQVAGQHVLGRWNFRDCRFEGCLSIKSATKLSQDMSFLGSRFSGKAVAAELEGNYRKIRTLFEALSDRDSEGQFYALEKRCQRLSLPRRSIARAISALYDWVSEYGLSYERALMRFAWVQVVAFAVYSLASGSLQLFGTFSLARTWELLAFTFAQIAKPFELLANRTPEGIAASIVGDGSVAAWALLSMLHSFASLVVLGLAILALRWRFRRA